MVSTEYLSKLEMYVSERNFMMGNPCRTVGQWFRKKEVPLSYAERITRLSLLGGSASARLKELQELLGSDIRSKPDEELSVLISKYSGFVAGMPMRRDELRFKEFKSETDELADRCRNCVAQEAGMEGITVQYMQLSQLRARLDSAEKYINRYETTDWRTKAENLIDQYRKRLSEHLATNERTVQESKRARIAQINALRV